MLLSLLLALLPSVHTDTPLHVFLRGGPKTHGPNQHEHEKWVGEWKKLLSDRGAAVEGALRFPTEEELAHTDVLVMYAADGGSIHGDDRTHLESYLARGGGIVALHDAVVSDDPEWWKSVLGGAWENGKAKWHEGLVDLYFTDRDHPITAGISNFRFTDELYTDLNMIPEARVLVRGFQTVFDASPQAWVLEKDKYRSFVAISGHEWDSFSHPAWRTLVLRGIAWAGKRDAELLTSKEELAQLRYPPGGPLAPEKSAPTIELNPDFNLSLVAAEPLIVNPISIDWDARGRMWVAETPGYPEKEKFSGVPAHDEISILSDSDGDGRMDKKQVFYTGLDLVTSLVFHRDGVIVTQSPEILFLRDTNGDGVAETREVLFSGFGYGDTHAVMSNLRWGMDGWIYATQGYSGGDSRNITNAAGKNFGHIGNGLFRFKPDGSAIEMVSNYGSNTWGCDFDDEGELFFTMANGAHLRHVVVPERVFSGGRMGEVESWADCPDHDRVVPLLTHTDAPYAQIDFVGGFTAASGCMIYTGGAWPAKEWNNAHFVAEPTVHLVHHDVLTPSGVTFKGTKARDAEFLAGKDLWFRPVHMRVGPDGALYVLDFYNQAVVHNDTRGPQHGPTNFALRPDRDHKHGRIWRAQHKQATKLELRDLAQADEGGLEQALESPNAWTRNTAERLLVERGKPAQLARALASKSADTRIAAQWTRARLAGYDAATWKLASNDASLPLERTAARIASELAPNDEACRAELVRFVHAADARLRLLALVALGDQSASEPAVDAVVAEWSSFKDLWSKNAALRVASKLAAHALERIGAGKVGAADGLMGELTRRAARARDGAACAGILALVGTSTTVRAPEKSQTLDILARELPVESAPELTPELKKSLVSLLGSGSMDVASAALRLVQRWDKSNSMQAETARLADHMAQILTDTRATLPTRTAALATLLSMPERRAPALEGARNLLDPATELADGLALVDVLGRIEDPAAARLLAQAYPALSAKLQDAIFERLAARASWSAVLLDAIEAKTVDPRTLGAQKQHRLRNSPDAAVAARAQKLFAGGNADSMQIDALIAKLLPEVDRPGDAAKGKLVFTENCAACHTANGEGGKIGPDISGMGSHGAAALLPSILDPSRTVEAAFVEWSVATKDDELFSGILAREGRDSVLLRWNGGEKEIARADIETLKNTGRSPMPMGLEKLGAEGLRDVIAYLSQGTEGFRVLPLGSLCSRNSLDGLYDHRHTNEVLKPKHFGLSTVFGVPFEALDPARTPSNSNVIVMKGGSEPDWDCKKTGPTRVEVPVGCAVQQVHVLGGIAAWGFPYHREKTEILKWTWKYHDGTSEEVVLHNGVEFGDWIARNDVPGSTFVEGFLADDSWGQIRFHSLAPSKPGVVDSIVLESYDNDFAPTILAMTAELPGTKRVVLAKPKARTPVALDVLVVGGGSSHDFAQWYGQRDLATLGAAGIAKSYYTENTEEVLPQLPLTKLLVLTNNQPLEGDELRLGILSYVERGGSLMLLHPATWYNWPDWPEYNAKLVGGGAHGHEEYREFIVSLTGTKSPILDGLPPSFGITDELYQAELGKDARCTVLAKSRSKVTQKEYPCVWTRTLGQGRILCMTLGHDGAAHEHSAYQKLLVNGARWLLSNPQSK
ncbi:MAG: ThuA domain-containing protein [Planctomycetes bacterium]|nr:ThuA domain-containing protein [Planctomycetota bacterium]